MWLMDKKTVSMPLVSWLALAWVAIGIGLMLAGVI